MGLERKKVTLKGMTLIELLILLAFFVIIFAIALPTLKSPEVTDIEQFARRELKYLYERERAYFIRNGKYASFAELAKEENGGPFLDRRFVGKTSINERGVLFTGPSGDSDKLIITAKLPGGTKTLQVDQTGQITVVKTEEKAEKESPLSVPKIELPSPEDVVPGRETMTST